MLESRGAVRIEQPPEVVFDYLADMRNEPKWLPGAAAVEQTTPGAVGLGTIFAGRYAERAP